MDASDMRFHRPRLPAPAYTLGSLNNDDGDGNGNENGRNAVGLDSQNNNFARSSRFFVHFFAVVERLQLETSYFHVLWGT